MRKIIKGIVSKYGAHLLSLSVAMSTLASNSCRFLWHEPEEPEGMREFRRKSGFKNDDCESIKQIKNIKTGR